MASLSYWFLSPSVFLAVAGKLKGWDRTRPTPAFDWRSAVVDVVIPAKNEESSVALCLASLFEQDLPVRKVTVIDDGSRDRTAQVVRRFRELSGKAVELVVRPKSVGKTPALREQCESSDADAVLVLDADTVLVDRNYLSRSIEELFRNAGVASVCGEVMPLTRRRRRAVAKSSDLLCAIAAEFSFQAHRRPGLFQRLMEFVTVIYRSALYLFLQRVLYDGHMKMFGSRLNPIGCAVVYRTARLHECFEYARPRMGDDLSNSEDVFIGHFFVWKGWRNVQVRARCESIEPPAERLPRQMYLWSTSFLQTLYYFRDLPLSPLRQSKNGIAALFSPRQKPAPGAQKRRIQEQYRAPWGEQFTKRLGRRVGLVDLVSMIEKISYPLLLVYFAFFNPAAALVTIAVEAVLATVGVFAVADSGARFKSAGMMLLSTPIRLVSVAVDLAASLGCLLDLATGNRNWRK